MVRSALPDPPLTSVLPAIHQPSPIGVPIASMTRGSDLARWAAILYASEDLTAVITVSAMAAPKMHASTIKDKQPVGMNHFQFRAHQPGRAATGVDDGP